MERKRCHLRECRQRYSSSGGQKRNLESTPDLAKSVPPPKETSGEDMEEIWKHVLRTEITFDDEKVKISANHKSETLQQSKENLCQNG